MKGKADATEGGDAAHIPLPADLSDPAVQARSIFDHIARLYDRVRPGYPGAAVSDLQRLCRITEMSAVLEIGCGTGQLTRDLAVTGAQIRGVEPGQALVELARRNLSTFANVELIASTFESFETRPASYDVVVSATAFHWIDPNLSYVKAATVLRSGGRLALLTNVHSAGGTHTEAAFAQAVRDLHRRLAPEVGAWTFPPAEDIDLMARGGGDIAAVWGRVDRRLWDPPPVGDLFEPPSVHIYPWLANYNPDDYVAMLASQSSYALLDEGRRRQLLDGIRRLISKHLGDMVTKEYVTVLAVAGRSEKP
jgi:SAM-dependent methyltransferase